VIRDGPLRSGHFSIRDGNTFDAGQHRKNSLAAWLPICSAAPRGQAPKPHRARQWARGLTAKAWTELSCICRQPDRIADARS
jgi:hypothetical protein